jgi:hypothetical protein
MVAINQRRHHMNVILPLPAALAVAAALAFVALYLQEDQPWSAISRKIDQLRAPIIPAPAPAPAAAPRVIRREIPPVVPGRHRLENAFDFPAAPYRPFVGVLNPPTARPYIPTIEIQREENPTVELTPATA